VTADSEREWQALDAGAAEAYRRGAYADAVVAAERALALACQAFEPRHPNTLASLNNLAFVYQEQGRYREAEQLYKEAVEGGATRCSGRRTRTRSQASATSPRRTKRRAATARLRRSTARRWNGNGSHSGRGTSTRSRA